MDNRVVHTLIGPEYIHYIVLAISFHAMLNGHCCCCCCCRCYSNLLLLKQKVPEVIENCSLIQSKIVYHKCFDFIALHCILGIYVCASALCRVQHQKHIASSDCDCKILCSVVNDTNTIYLLMKMSKK